MNYDAGAKRLAAYRQDIAEIRKKMREALAETEPEEVRDYVLSNIHGPVRLSELFGVHEDLILIHNMGTRCPACTMWADGYTGVYPHITSRAAFVISSPDAPDVQKAFAEGRGWNFPMVSHAGTSFAADMGYAPDGKMWPGISVFRRDGARILRVSDQRLGPYDDLNPVWHMFDMLAGGAKGWFPRFSYA